LLFQQRVFEATGGKASSLLSTQLTLALGMLTYSSLKAKGFRMLPIVPSKMPRYASILMMGVFGHYFV
jgi:hypothetical protein